MGLDEFIVDFASRKYSPNIVEDYIVNYDDITEEFIVDLWIKPPKPIWMLRFIVNADGNIEFLKEEENAG